MRTITWTTEDEEGEEVERELAAKRVVCERCDGEGKILNPAIGEHAYSPEELEREFWDDGQTDYRAEYLKGGRGIYGVTCPRCQGEKVVDVVDLDELAAKDPELAKAYWRHLRAEDAYRRQVAAEMAYDC